MLQMPRIPPAKGFRFENVEAHQLRQQLAAEIRETIMVLIKSTYVPAWQDMFRRFADCIEPGSVRDNARIPYPVTSPNDRHGTQIGCVYARLGWVIKLYWDMHFDGVNNTGLIRGLLADLRAWAARGIDKCKLAGSPRDGYWLEVV